MMRKKAAYLFFSIVLTIVGVIITATVSSAAVSKEGILPFEDVKNTAWYADAVEFCYVNEVVKGMNEYTFSPSSALTRAQFVMMLANAENIDVSGYESDKFSDVRVGQWYCNAVSWAYNEGIVAGTSEDRFSPNAFITREALSRIMANYMTGKGYDVEISEECLERFSDKDKISDWAVDPMKYTVSAGLISGVTDNTVDPKGNVTRAQAARIFMLYLQNYSEDVHEHSYTEASCISSAECVKCGLKNGLPLGHEISNSFSCKSDSQSKCTRCGYWVSASAMPHDYAKATCGKPETCKRCSAQRGTPVGEHIWWAATCKNPKMCKVCYKTEGVPIPHKWTDATCKAPKTCVSCGKTEGGLGEHIWWSATCKNPKMCKVCYKTEGSALGHSWKAADCTAPKTCTRWGCNATEGNALSATGQHTWWAATCKNPKMCKVCYKTEGDPIPHSWEGGNCKLPKTCKLCGAKGELAEHQWWSATCINPKMCKICYKTEGSALGHNFKAATCTDPKSCKRCGYAEGQALGGEHSWWSATCTNPKMCKKCYTTEGKPLDHQWIAASCTAAKKCKLCGKTEGSALGHTTSSGKCTRCNLLYFATSFDKARYYIAQKSGTVGGVILYKDLGGGEKHYVCVSTFSSDTITLSYEHSLNSKVYTHLTVEFRRNGECNFVYVRTDGSAFGVGKIDSASYTAGSFEAFDIYDGNNSSDDSNKLNTALDRAFALCNEALKSAYGGSVADLGFTLY